MAKNIKRSEIGEILVKLRTERRYNQQKLADMLNIKRDTYARYETDTNPPIGIIKDLSKIYNISCDVLLGNDSDDYAAVLQQAPSMPRLSTYIAYNQNGEEITVLSDDEFNLVERYRKLSQEKQEAMLIFMGE